MKHLMNGRGSKAAKTVAVLLACMTAAFSNAAFTKADLEKMVSELSVHLPQHKWIEYPIQCEVVEKNEVNAYATAVKIEGKTDKVQGKMVVFTGLVKMAKEDLRLIRAVVAHELAHLAKGHIFKSMKVQDVDLLFTRQLEYEADVVGASALVRAGYPKKDMYDMLMMLGELDKEYPAAAKLLGDHADANRRAAQVADDPRVMKSTMAFEVGEALIDCRTFRSAMKAFDKALEIEPKLVEAAYNSALAALVDYYENLPMTWKEATMRPDFGPFMRMDSKASRLLVVEEKDRANYREALIRITRAQNLMKDSAKMQALTGLAQILEPDHNPQSISDGIATLQKALSSTISEADKLTIANNIGIGLQLQGNSVDAAMKMIDAQRSSKMYNAALAQNLGTVEPTDKFKKDATLIEAVLITYLNNSPSDGSKYEVVKTNYNKLCTKFSLKPRPMTPKPAYLTKAMSMVVDGKQYNLFQTGEELVTDLGRPERKIIFDPDYKGLFELVWQAGQVTALCEEFGSEDIATSEALRLTSYKSGSYVQITPRDPSVQPFKILVGMTTKDFNDYLDLSKGQKRSFVKCGTMEEWVYFDALNMGVCVKGDAIIGITVTPAAKTKSF